MKNVTSEDDRIRQSERTVDNLKRLYAVLFALSFAVLANGVALKLTSAGEGEAWTLQEILAHIEVTLIFALTAGLFYYQSDRFLDVALARRPLPEVSAWKFAGSYLVNVVTMAPFYLMALALGPDLSRGDFGFNWYLLAYVILIANGLLLLFLGGAGRVLLRHRESAAEIEALTVFWMGWNSLMLLVAVGLFRWFSDRAGLCVAGDVNLPLGLGFVTAVGATILLRDAVDFWHGWPILYPVADTDGGIRRRPALRALRARSWLRLIVTWLAVGLTGFSLWLLASTGVFVPGALAAACAS